MGRSTEDSILTLDEVAVQKQTGNLKSYHVYGTFRRLEKKSNILFWVLSDETCTGGELFKIIGPLEEYPDPKPGDTVRFHRVFTDKQYRQPVVSKGRNVVIWRAHKYKPIEISSAENPTITEQDEEKRRNLESLYCKSLTQLTTIDSNSSQFYNVCGRVECKKYDPFSNAILTINDGSSVKDLRVFSKKIESDSEEHFKTAETIQVGCYVVATQAKLNKQSNLDLSANLMNGRSLRIVEPQSILGVILCERVGLQSSQEQGPNNLRRSPRLQAMRNTAQTTFGEDQLNQSESDLDIESYNFTKLSDLKITPESSRIFINIAGQVREEPRINSYGHCVFQLVDGTVPSYESFDAREFEKPFKNSVVLVVYRKQKDNDTNKHMEVAEKLHDRDLVRLNNVRALIRDGKLKLELSANLTNNKSIRIVDNTSDLGIRLLEQVNNPHIEGLVESQPSSSSELYDYEGEPPI